MVVKNDTENKIEKKKEISSEARTKYGAIASFAAVGLSALADTGFVPILNQVLYTGSEPAALLFTVGMSALLAVGANNVKMGLFDFAGVKINNLVSPGVDEKKFDIKYKPRLMTNAFLSIGAGVLFYKLHTTGFDMRHQYGIHTFGLMNYLTPNVLLLSTVMACGYNAIKSAFIKKEVKVVENKGPSIFREVDVDQLEELNFKDAMKKVSRGFKRGMT